MAASDVIIDIEPNECVSNTSIATTNSVPCNLEDSLRMRVTARCREVGLALMRMPPASSSIFWSIVEFCRTSTPSEICRRVWRALALARVWTPQWLLNQFATRRPQLLNTATAATASNQRKSKSTSCIVNIEPGPPSHVMRRAATFDAPCRNEPTINLVPCQMEDSLRVRLTARCREVGLAFMRPLLAIILVISDIVEFFQESTPLELCITFLFGYPISTIRLGKTPSKWWLVDRALLTVFRILTSLRFVTIVLSKNEQTQKSLGDIYHFLTKDIRALSYAAVTLQMPVLAMMVYLLTSSGKSALALVLAITKYQVANPGTVEHRVTLALKVCFVFALGWVAFGVYLYAFVFDSSTYWGAAIIFCIATNLWVIDVFMGLATIIAMYFTVRDWQDTNFENWFAMVDRLYARPTFNTALAQIVVKHLGSVLVANARPSFFVGFCLFILHVLFVPLSSVLFEILEGIPTNQYLRAMLVVSLLVMVLMYTCPNLNGALFNRVMVPRVKKMVIKLEESSGMHIMTKCGRQLAVAICSLKQNLEMSIGVRLWNVIPVQELGIAGFLWGVVMFYFIVIPKFHNSTNSQDGSNFNVTTTSTLNG